VSPAADSDEAGHAFQSEAGHLKSPPIPPLFKADTAILIFEASKDGKLIVKYRKRFSDPTLMLARGMLQSSR
jgi:hypothetical protein